MFFNQSVVNQRTAPAIVSDTLTNRPAAAVSQNGLIFIDQSTPALQQFIGGSWLTIASGGTPANVILQGGNSFGVPMVIGTNDNQTVIFKANNINQVTIDPSGGSVTIPNRLLYSNTANSVFVGASNGTFPTASNRRQVVVGVSNTRSDINSQYTYQFGNFNALQILSGNNIQLGGFHVFTNGDGGAVQVGYNTTVNYIPDTTSPGLIAFGTQCQVLHKYSAVFGVNSKTYAPNQLIFGECYINTDATGFNDVYFGTGCRSTNPALNGSNVVINGSGAGEANDKNGGNLTIAAGKGSGNGTPGKLIFQTPNSGIAGTSTLQTLVTRLTIDANTGLATFSNNIITQAPSGNGAGSWALGKVVNTGIIADTTKYLEVAVDGVVVKIVIGN